MSQRLYFFSMATVIEYQMNANESANNAEVSFKKSGMNYICNIFTARVRSTTGR